MKVLVNVTEIWSKLVEVEVPGGMDTETGVEWARDKVEQDYLDGKIDMTVDIDGRTDFDVLDPSSVSCGSTIDIENIAADITNHLVSDINVLIK